MPRVRQKPSKNQPRAVTKTPLALPQHMIPLDDGTLTTPVTLAMIQALIPLGLRAVEEALLAEVEALFPPLLEMGKHKQPPHRHHEGDLPDQRIRLGEWTRRRGDHCGPANNE